MRPVSFALIALALAACEPAIAPPRGAQIECTADAECPENWVCRTAVHLCVKPAGEDQTGPKVVDPRIEKGIVGSGGDIVVSFATDEEVVGAPVVLLMTETPRSFTRVAFDGGRHVFRLLTNGAEGGGERAIVASLMDASGNVTTNAPVATVFIDQQAPRILSVTGPTHPLKRGDTITLTANLDEATTGTARVGGRSLTALASSDPLVASFSLPVPDDAAEGPAEAVVAFTDPAGNTVERTLPAFVTFDFTKPSVADVALETPSVRAGALASVVLMMSEPLDGDPVVELAPTGGGPALGLAVARRIGTSYELFARIPAGTTDGAWTLRLVSSSDPAGNKGDPRTLGELLIDTTAPTVVDIGTPGRSSPVWRAGEALVLAIAVSEPLREGSPRVTLDVSPSRALPCVADDERHFTCTLDGDGRTSGEERPEGRDAIVIELEDLAGNQGLLSFPVTLDFTPPRVVDGSAHLELVPDQATNPLSIVSSARPGTRVRVSFALSERVARNAGAAALQVVAAGTSTPSFATFSDADPFFISEWLVPADAVEGPVTLDVIATDAAGNEGRSRLALSPGLVVDRTPPAPPPVETPGAIVLRRRPWGSVDPAVPAGLSLEIATGTLAADTTLLVKDGPTTSATELARGTASPIVIAASDRPDVWVLAVDGAGNVSAGAQVHDAKWTATLRGKVPGSRFENPTTLVTTPVFEPTKVQEVTIAREPAADLIASAAGVDSKALVFEAEASWRDRTPSAASPSPRSSRLVWDSTRGRAVLFGGDILDSQDTWEWDGASGRWLRRSLSGMLPPPRSHHMMAFDSSRGRVVVFGGCSAGRSLDDLWEWDGETGVWFDRTPIPRPPSWPTGRFDSATAWDGNSKRVLAFGGINDCVNVSSYGTSELWAWDGRRGTFANLTPATPQPGTWPTGRRSGAFAWDRVRRRAVLFGGDIGKDDLWEWDGSAWADRTPSPRPVAWPHGRFEATLSDADNGKVVLIGGRYVTTANTSLSDVWTWDGTTWSARPDAPEAIVGAAATLDPLRNKVVLFGGITVVTSNGGFANTFRQRTDDWDPQTGGFTNRTPDGLRPPGDGGLRPSAPLSFDSTRRRFVAYGGGLYTGNLWEFDPEMSRWQDRTPNPLPTNGTWPGNRIAHALAWDSSRNTTIVFGGRRAFNALFDDLWEWNGTQWTNRTPTVRPTAWPEARLNPGLAWVPGCACLALFGGAADPDSSGFVRRSLRDFWTWSPVSGTWTNRTPTAPPPGTFPLEREGAALSWDPVREELVLFGGYRLGASDAQSNTLRYSMSLPDLWTWKPSTNTWTNRTPTLLRPPEPDPVPAAPFNPTPWPADWRLAGRNIAFVFDAARERFASFPDPAEWAPIEGHFNPRPSTGLRMAWPFFDTRPGVAMDPASSKAILLSIDTTWEWSGGAGHRPAVVWTVPLDALADLTTTELQRLDITARAGGTGKTPGAELLVWDADTESWKSLGSNGSTASATVAFAGADASILGRYVSGTPPAVTLAIVPTTAAGNAVALATVAVDAVELTISYRR